MKKDLPRGHKGAGKSEDDEKVRTIDMRVPHHWYQCQIRIPVLDLLSSLRSGARERLPSNPLLFLP